MEFKPIAVTLVEHLRTQIITGQLRPGEKLNESKLAKAFDISRHPLREALLMLESEHLVVNIPRKGGTVSDISTEDMKKLYQAREMVECYAIELLKANNIREVPEINVTLFSPTWSHTPSEERAEKAIRLIDAHAELHRKLIAATGNGWIIKFYKAITPHLARYLFLHLYIPNVTEESQREHQEILDCLRVGSFDRARENMRVHIRNSYQRVEKAFLGFRKVP